MTGYEKSLAALMALFAKDCTFVLATARDNTPSARVVDAYFDDGAFWVVTYAKSKKVLEIEQNPNVALCRDFHVFQGKARNMGHPLREENRAIREKLIRVFEPWYFAHNNEGDADMCYVKIDPESGFFHRDSTGYRVNFTEKTAVEIPFSPDISMNN